MTAPYGIIADDFTGATDVASLIARQGARVVVQSGIPADDPGAADIHVIALKIRTIPVAEAVAQALAALDWLQGAGCVRIYWKYCSTFDSTPQGNIGPVATALMARLGTAQTVYCPAFPENRRTVYKGHLFVGDQALDDSPMKDHPLTPMTDANLCRLLAPQVPGRVGLIPWQTVQGDPEAIAQARTALTGDGVDHVILDAINDADLTHLGIAFADLPLATGGSAFAAALHAARFAQSTTAKRPSPPDGATLILSGSCSKATHEQVARYLATNAPALQISAADADPAGSDTWLAGAMAAGGGLIYSTTDPDTLARVQAASGSADPAARIEAEMARIAQAALAAGARRFIVAGGETSGAVTQALGVTRLEIGGEIAPGVPWCLADTLHGPVALVLKSGNFGAADFFDRATRILGGETECMS